MFSSDLTMELSENMEINQYAIKLIDKKQSLYGPIYILNLVELEILKTYIEIHLKTGFIQPFKSPVGAPILSNEKLDSSLHLCVDYQGLNNLIIQNQYPLLLIGKSLD